MAIVSWVLQVALSDSWHFKNFATETSISPCGICRQVIREFSPLEIPILLVPGNYCLLQVLDSVQEDDVREMTLGELFPESLEPGHLLLKLWRTCQCLSFRFKILLRIWCRWPGTTRTWWMDRHCMTDTLQYDDILSSGTIESLNCPIYTSDKTEIKHRHNRTFLRVVNLKKIRLSGIKRCTTWNTKHDGFSVKSSQNRGFVGPTFS